MNFCLPLLKLIEKETGERDKRWMAKAWVENENVSLNLLSNFHYICEEMTGDLILPNSLFKMKMCFESIYVKMGPCQTCTM